MELTRAELLARAERLTEGHRVLLGITGPPGAGKSTLAEWLVAELSPQRAVLAPMDGFHLGDALLVEMGLRARKGAPETFDAAGYAATLARIRAGTDTVYLPRFERDREDSTAAAIAVRTEVPLVITEGNYLLNWPVVRAVMDECWYLQPDDDVRRERLVRRRRGYGDSEEVSRRWARGSDEDNARIVRSAIEDADLLVTLID